MGYLKYLNPLYHLGRACEYFTDLISLGKLDDEKENLEYLVQPNERRISLGELEIPENWGESRIAGRSIRDPDISKLMREPVHISKLPEDILD